MTEFICTHPYLYTFGILILSGFIWVLIFGLCRMASDSETDAEMRMMRHVRETDKLDEHGVEYEKCEHGKGLTNYCLPCGRTHGEGQ